MTRRNPAAITNGAGWRSGGDDEPLLDYLAAQAPCGGGTAAGLAWRWGVTRAHADARLNALPSRLVDVQRGEDGILRWRLVERPAPTEAALAARRFAAWLRGRGDHPDRATATALELGRAQELLVAGDLAALARLLKTPGFDPATVRRAVPPRHRDRLAGEVWALRADTAMQQGDTQMALRCASRAVALADDPEARCRRLGVWAAAARMVSPAGAHEAAKSLLAALELAAQLPPEASRRQVRHLAANLVAPQLALGDLPAASLAWTRSEALLVDADAAAVETGLRRVVLLARQGLLERAALAFSLLPTPPALPRWLWGWRARIEVTHLGALLSDERWAATFAEAWQLNQGYGFQRQLLLAELAACSRRGLPDLLSPELTGTLARALAAHHRRRHGCRPSECAVCRDAPLPHRAAHALGLQPGARDSFLGT